MSAIYFSLSCCAFTLLDAYLMSNFSSIIEKHLERLSEKYKCRVLLIPPPCSWEIHGQNHTLVNMQPSQLPGFGLPSSGQLQVSDFPFTPTLSIKPPSLQITRPFSALSFQCPAWFNNKIFISGPPERVDNVYGDRNLICTLLPASQVEEQAAATA